MIGRQSDEARTENSSGLRRASTLARRALARPVVARLIEPAAWAGALAVWSKQSEPGALRPIATLLTLALIARLISDTAPNLVVSPRLEDTPYDERPIRRALTRTKLLLVVAFCVGWHAIVMLAPPDSLPKAIAHAGGGAITVTLGLLMTLASFAAATPVVREHRGVPIARPNLGGSAGALLVLTISPLTGPAPGHILVAVSAAIIAGNVIVGGSQRYQAAARRLRSPSQNFAFGNLPTGSIDRGDEDQILLIQALAAAPFVIAPAWTGMVSLFTRDAHPLDAGVSALLAALPAILFDAKRPTRRFQLLSLSTVVVLAGLHFGTGADPYLRTAVVAASWPFASRLLAGGSAIKLGLTIVTFFVASVAIYRARPEFDAPALEVLFLFGVFALASRCDPLRAR